MSGRTCNVLPVSAFCSPPFRRLLRSITVGCQMIAATCLVVLPSSGCNRSEFTGYGVSGAVTYRGQPVPSGQIRFMPDRSKGNQGPQGFAEIRNGRYEVDPERGAVPGPVLVVISGADGKDRNDEQSRPYGKWLFKNHQVAVEIDGNEEMDFDVP